MTVQPDLYPISKTDFDAAKIWIEEPFLVKQSNVFQSFVVEVNWAEFKTGARFQRKIVTLAVWRNVAVILSYTE